MGLTITKFIGGDIDEYGNGQYAVYNKYPYYNSRRRPMTLKEQECFDRRNPDYYYNTNKVSSCSKTYKNKSYDTSYDTRHKTYGRKRKVRSFNSVSPSK